MLLAVGQRWRRVGSEFKQLGDGKYFAILIVELVSVNVAMRHAEGKVVQTKNVDYCPIDKIVSCAGFPTDTEGESNDFWMYLSGQDASK